MMNIPKHLLSEKELSFLSLLGDIAGDVIVCRVVEKEEEPKEDDKQAVMYVLRQQGESKTYLLIYHNRSKRIRFVPMPTEEPEMSKHERYRFDVNETLPKAIKELERTLGSVPFAELVSVPI